MNKRIENAITEATAISKNPISPYLKEMKAKEGSPAVYNEVIKQSMTKYRIPEYIQERILDGEPLKYDTGAQNGRNKI